MTTELYGITYLSNACNSQTTSSLELAEQILAKARPHNRAVGITGILVSCGDSFLQVLEGPKDAVLQLYQKISRDSRHRGLTTLIHQPIAYRQFNDWTMAHTDLSDDSSPELKQGFVRIETSSAIDLVRDYEFIGEYISLLQIHIQSETKGAKDDQTLIDHIHHLYRRATGYGQALQKLEKLTKREREVMRWVAQGSTNRQIAEQLNIAETTIKVHRGRVMSKLGLNSVAELVRAYDRLALAATV